MIAMFSFIQNFVARAHDDERGDFTIGGGGILGIIAIVLIILCAIVYLWINIDINEDPSAILR